LHHLKKYVLGQGNLGGTDKKVNKDKNTEGKDQCAGGKRPKDLEMQKKLGVKSEVHA